MQNVICPRCYPIVVPNCAESFTIPTGLAEGTVIFAQITDKFSNQYRFTATIDADGNATIQTAGFPPGLFTPYSGFFRFEVLGIDTEPTVPICATVDLTICGVEYGCVLISVGNVSAVSNDTPTPPGDPCICGYAFGSFDLQITPNEVGGTLTIEGFASGADFTSTGTLSQVVWNVREYVGGIETNTWSGTIIDGDFFNFTTPLTAATYQLVTRSEFSDGAVVIESTLFQVLAGTGVGKFHFAKTQVDEITAETSPCNTFSCEVFNPQIIQDGGGPARNFSPTFNDADYNFLESGTVFNDNVKVGAGEFDIIWVFNVDKTEWSDLPPGGPEEAGYGWKFVACVE